MKHNINSYALVVMLFAAGACGSRNEPAPFTGAEHDGPPAAPSASVQDRMARSDRISAKYQKSFDGLMAEMDAVTDVAKHDSAARLCIEPIVPEMLAFRKLATDGIDGFLDQNTCTDSSPDTCWLPFFDEHDRIYSHLTVRADKLRDRFNGCRSTPA